MRYLIPIIVVLLFFTTPFIRAQKERSDANIIGHVVDVNGGHIPFATISIENTTIGTSTDETGHFRLINLPAGHLQVKAQYLGYKAQMVEIDIAANETKEINFVLEEDVLGIEEVVVTADRNGTNRTNASTIVSTITPQLFYTTQSITLSEGLNFTPGLRMENNCQNCGFSQVRMNGMEGPYSQILINSRPIFSGLAGVYGLELIPSNMIERVEVIRGGGSALYGSNAIAGTINLILKDPLNNSYEFGTGQSITGVGLSNSGDPAADNNVNFNASVVSPDSKTGLAMYGFYRDRKPFDANNDGFSELTSIKNTTIGGRVYHRFGIRNKLAADFFNIKENRRGGDRHDYPLHMTNIAEAVEHDITTGALAYDQFFRESDKLSIYASGQHVDRDSYYGANHSLSSYGHTKDFSFAVGTQYIANFSGSSLIAGVEDTGARLKDKKLGYPDVEDPGFTVEEGPYTENKTVANQTTNTLGLFTQYAIDIGHLNVSLGARFDHYQVEDNAKTHDASTSGNVLSPRVTLKYNLLDDLQARASYSQGYRAPQIFDEDLHIETSGARQIIHQNDPGLEQETSHSFMASLDLNKQFNKLFVGFLIEGFYTQLDNAFANEFGEPDENGTVIYTRVNAEKGAHVQGVNLEANLIPSRKLAARGGFTFQKSEYQEVHELGETRFFRTPDQYGYFTIDWQPNTKFGIASTGNYTGKMLVPYNESVLKTSEPFFELGLKLQYNMRINGAILQIYTGMKNIFNAYQSDFDSGINRDPAYVYGPTTPRTVYFGIKVGNML